MRQKKVTMAVTWTYLNNDGNLVDYLPMNYAEVTATVKSLINDEEVNIPLTMRNGNWFSYDQTSGKYIPLNKETHLVVAWTRGIETASQQEMF